MMSNTEHDTTLLFCQNCNVAQIALKSGSNIDEFKTLDHLEHVDKIEKLERESREGENFLRCKVCQHCKHEHKKVGKYFFADHNEFDIGQTPQQLRDLTNGEISVISPGTTCVTYGHLKFGMLYYTHNVAQKNK